MRISSNLIVLCLLVIFGLSRCPVFAQTVPTSSPEGTMVLSTDEYVDLMRILVRAKRRRAYLQRQQLSLAPPPAGYAPPPRTVGDVLPSRSAFSGSNANERALDSLELLVRDLERRAARAPRPTATTAAEVDEQRLLLENLALQRQLDSMVFLVSRLERGQTDLAYRSQASASPSADTDRTELDRLRRELASRDLEMEELRRRQRTDFALQEQNNRRSEYADRTEIDRLRAEMRQLQDRYENDLRYRNDARRSDRRNRNVTVAPVVIGSDGEPPTSEPDSVVYANAEALATLLNKVDLLEARLAILDGEAEARDRERTTRTDTRIRDYEAEIGTLNRTITRLESELDAMRNRPAPAVAPPSAPTVVPVPVPTPTPDVYSYAARTPNAVVYFANGSSRVDPKFHAELDRIAATLDPFAELQLTVQGFTSKTGSVAVNQRLARERVENVRTYLRSRGVTPERIRTDPVGIDTGATSDERARRAVVGLVVVR